MAELKTKKTDESVEAFLAGVADEGRRRDCRAILEMMQEATGAEPKMWGDSMVGFGDRRYTYASGRQGDWFLTGFSPRKQNLTLYLNLGSGWEENSDLLARLGKHTLGKGCLYIKRLSDVDPAVLRELIRRSAQSAACDDARGVNREG
jgi:hypothetical protein